MHYTNFSAHTVSGSLITIALHVDAHADSDWLPKYRGFVFSL